MGLGTSFAVLVAAEMLGVKAGLGWYLQCAQAWAANANMYAALLIMALLCSGLITLLFRLGDRQLSWQKCLVRRVVAVDPSERAHTVNNNPVRGTTLTIREVSDRFDLEGQPLPVLDRISSKQRTSAVQRARM